ncbi:MAG: patatin-like phospholipase family protein [Bacillota bacterium]|nr:patatin-like phospholipase family protein [Bacillota bacterium]
MKADMVFEGGGVKGIAFVGAICCLEENGYEWENIAGTSAGSIIASLLAAGYTGKELRNIMMKVDYKKFLDKDKVQSIPIIGRPMGLFGEKGIYLGDKIEEWVNNLLEKKGKTKFKHITKSGKCPLKIITSDITKQELIILPDDLIKYGIDPMEYEIAKAVRMSISIPFYFKPVKFQYNKGVSYFVDGGILSNFPIWIFDVRKIPAWPTFGFKLVDDKLSYTATGKTDVISFILDIFNTMIDRNEQIYLKDQDSVRTICIPTLGIHTTQFDISKEASLELFQSGYHSTDEFLNTWDFQAYIKKYRMKNTR